MLTKSKPAKPAFRKVKFPAVDLDIETRADGTMLVSTKDELELIAPNVAVGLMASAQKWSDRIAMAERDSVR